MDSESVRYSRLEELVKSNNTCSTSDDSDIDSAQMDLHKSEERLQALSVIMLYLCTGLQSIQGIMTQ